jgi:hypothetical protein
MSSSNFSRISRASADEMLRDAADPRFRTEGLPPPCADTPGENYEIFCALMRFLAPTFVDFLPRRDVQRADIQRL